jgi:hypothetical protein
MVAPQLFKPPETAAVQETNSHEVSIIMQEQKIRVKLPSTHRKKFHEI